MSQDNILETLKSGNTEWIKQVKMNHPNFFQDSANKQAPKVLWIGCSDSRVPESVITGQMPGHIFVHRNIANQFHPQDDDNAMSVLAYAVGHLGVTHVLVVGHTNCGGAQAAQDHVAGKHATHEPALDRWLAPLTDLARRVEPQGDLNKLIEANVRKQVENIATSEVLKKARAEGKYVQVLGWIYELETGQLRNLDDKDKASAGKLVTKL